MGNQGHIVACDVEEGRLQTVRELSSRLGLSIIETLRLDPVSGEMPAGPFDAVLVDVPCSNTGVLGRRPEVRWRLAPGDLYHLGRLQMKLLEMASRRVKEGGVLVYSTCSIEPEENGELIRKMLRAIPELELEAEEIAIPGRPSDGGYWARLRRKGEDGDDEDQLIELIRRQATRTDHRRSWSACACDEDDPVLQRIRPKDMPWACHDEESEMGESTVHTLSAGILLYSLTFHFAPRTGFRIFANLNLHFSQAHPNLFITPDVMVVRPRQPLPERLPSYRIGEQGPPPLLVGEVLSPPHVSGGRSGPQADPIR